MGGACLEGGEDEAQLGTALLIPIEPMDLPELGTPLGERPRLVQHEGVDMERGLEGLRIADQQPLLSRMAYAYHDGRRRS